jgi:hypothetical protein
MSDKDGYIRKYFENHDRILHDLMRLQLCYGDPWPLHFFLSIGVMPPLLDDACQDTIRIEKPSHR